MNLKLVTPPATVPLSLGEAKEHCRVDADDSDQLLVALIAAAVQHIDGPTGRLGRALAIQTWDMRLDCFPTEITLPLPPLRSVDQITYVDTAGAAQTLSSSVYRVIGLGDEGRRASIVEAYDQTWPTTRAVREAVTVRFTAGYTIIPEPIKQAMKLMVGHWYDNPGAPAPEAVAALLAPWRVELVLTMTDERLETTKQLAARVGLSDRQVRHLIQTRQLEHVMIGQRVHIPLGAFARFLEANKVTPCQDETRDHACAGSKSEAATTSHGPSEDAAASARLARQTANKLKSRSPSGCKAEGEPRGHVIPLTCSSPRS